MEPSCYLCRAAVSHKKYTCEHCGGVVCSVHRGKNKGLFSNTYFCIPACQSSPAFAGSVTSSRSTPPPAKHQSSTTRSSPPPPPPGGCATLEASSAATWPFDQFTSASDSVRGRTTALQTSFGVIQEDADADDHPVGRIASPSAGLGPARCGDYRGMGANTVVRVPSGSDGGEAPTRSPPCRDPPAVAYYNHRGELQQLPTASSPTPSTLSAARLSRGSLATPTPEPVPFRPPATLAADRRQSVNGSAPAQPHNSAMRPSLAPNRRVRCVGTALVAPEPVNPSTMKREVLIGPDMKLNVTPEERVRFVEVELTSSNALVRGTVLGIDGDALVWHERGKRFAQRLLPSDYRTMEVIVPARCKHCGSILPRDEADEHVASHKRGGGIDIGTAVGDELLGTACGDTLLLLRLSKVRRLGAGAQGEVWLCRDSMVQPSAASATTTTQQPQYVLKDMRCADEREAIAKYQQSVRLMSMNHVHIIPYVAVQRHLRDPIVTVLMPFYDEGDLAGLIRHQQGKFDEAYLLSLLLQMAHALEFLHSRTPSIIHGDIKPENILLFNGRQQIVLMDLDASVELHLHHAHANVKVGTSAWMAPEALHDMQETTKSDVWSLGLVAYVLAALPDFPLLPCDATSSNESINSKSWSMAELLRKVGVRMLSRGYSREFAQLTARMLHHTPSRRPTAAELVDQITKVMTSQLVADDSQGSQP